MRRSSACASTVRLPPRVRAAGPEGMPLSPSSTRCIGVDGVTGASVRDRVAAISIARFLLPGSSQPRRAVQGTGRRTSTAEGSLGAGLAEPLGNSSLPRLDPTPALNVEHAAPRPKMMCRRKLTTRLCEKGGATAR
jgi:hypothetical protein